MTKTTILVGDVRVKLATLASESVHCAVTSPPYFGLRDYGCAGQIGLEATPDAYVAELVAVFRELRRVLRADGTLWLNLGDSYAGGKTGRDDNSGANLARRAAKFGTGTGEGRGPSAGKRRSTPGVASKQRLMIPARVALALQSDGWYLRDEIIWHKPNPMPVSVTDRTTPAHEMLYMFAKSSRYYYDMEAIKEPAVTQRGRGRPDGAATFEKFGRNTSCGTSPDGTRQPRSVWSIATRPFKGAHFATFPPDLVRPCILAGCPVGGTVLDPFFGAGTTGLVAAELGRNAVGIELNPEYAAIAAKRLDAGKSAVRVSFGLAA